MHQVGFARSALLPAVLARRKEIGASQQIEIGLRMIAPDLIADFFDANHKGWSVVSCQLSVVSCQLSVVSCQLSVVGCRLSVVSCQLSVVGCQLRSLEETTDD